MRQVVWTRISAMDLYIRQVEKPLMGKTGKYQSRLLRDNVQHLPLQVLRTHQGSVRNSLDTASLASKWGRKNEMDFLIPSLFSVILSKILSKKKKKSARC